MNIYKLKNIYIYNLVCEIVERINQIKMLHHERSNYQRVNIYYKPSPQKVFLNKLNLML